MLKLSWIAILLKYARPNKYSICVEKWFFMPELVKSLKGKISWAFFLNELCIFSSLSDSNISSNYFSPFWTDFNRISNTFPSTKCKDWSKPRIKENFVFLYFYYWDPSPLRRLKALASSCFSLNVTRIESSSK